LLVRFKRIDELSGGVVDFYTVYFQDNELSELELFDEKEFAGHQEELQIINNSIMEMMDRGAKKWYFREEPPADALPGRVPQEIMDLNNDFGIRLYCVRLNDNMVVLLNGDVKTNQKPQLCANVKGHFMRARAIGMELDKMIAAGELNLQARLALENLEIEI
jgi:hypothetical protein